MKTTLTTLNRLALTACLWAGVALPFTASAVHFNIVLLGDVQNYTQGTDGGKQAMFTAQTSWIKNHIASSNIVLVSQVGDLVNDGSCCSGAWQNAANAMSTLGTSVCWSVALGNHDTDDVITHYYPNCTYSGVSVCNRTTGSGPQYYPVPGGADTYFNNYFGNNISTFPWYGDHYATGDNRNHYDLFTANDIPFIVIYLEWEPDQDTNGHNILGWAGNVLNYFPDRRAVIITHELLNGNSFTASGSAVYNAMKTHPNVFLMACGHINVGHRQDTYNGSTITTISCDFQSQSGGGNGYLQILDFDPEARTLHVQSYSPYLNAFWTGNSTYDYTLTMPYLPKYTAIVGSGDWNGDGYPDLLARDQSGYLWLCPGSGTNGWLVETNYTKIGSGWKGWLDILGAGDVNGDGHPDVLAVDKSGILYNYPGDGTGGWLARTTNGSGWLGMDAIIAPGDLNGDGSADILGVDSSGYLWFYPNDGTGNFPSKIKHGGGWNAMTATVGPGDWNGDGRRDLFARDASGHLLLYPGTGTGTFGAPIATNSGWQIFDTLVSVGDWDRNGHPCIVGRDRSGNLFLYPGNGSGGFLARRQISSGW